MTVRALGWLGIVPLAGLVIGVAVAIASSPSSLSPDRRQTTGVVYPTPSPVPSPSPSVTVPGILGQSPRLQTNGSNVLIAYGSNVVIGSADGGRTWITVRQPAGAQGMAVDPSNPRHAIAGGTAVQVTGDGGATWSPALAPPPGRGPYVPVAVSALEPNVWFFSHQGRLVVTRDASASWSDLGSLPAVSGPVVVAGQALGQFFLASSGRIFELSGYGERVTELAPLGAGTITDLAVIGGDQVSVVARVAGRGAYVLRGGAWTLGSGLTGPVAGGASGAVVVGSGGGRLGSPGLVSVSGDGGRAWAAASGLPPDQSVDALAGQATSSVFFAYCAGGDLYSSGNGGRTWTLLSSALRAGGG